MTNLITPEPSSHWYYSDGRPCYELPMKTDPSRTRAPTVRDARELDLWPSVTGILNMVHKPALQAWIVTQGILSALTLPRLEGESADDFAKRVVQDSRTESSRAADFGTTIHGIAEAYLNNAIPDTLSAVELSFLEGFMLWCKEKEVKPIRTELSFAYVKEGYGGKMDFFGYINGNLEVVDWKTQGTKPERKVNFYPDWAPQLAAYRAGVVNLYNVENLPQIGIRSVVISSTEPGRVESQLWEPDDWAWEAFLAAKTLYYSPLGPGASLARRFTA